MHPHPGPTIYDIGFDDSDGGNWGDDARSQSDREDPEECDDGTLTPGADVPGSTGDQLQSDLVESAWQLLMQPPADDASLMHYLNSIGCRHSTPDMQPNRLHQVWGGPMAGEDADHEGDADEVRPDIADDSSDEDLEADGVGRQVEPDSDDEPLPPLAQDDSSDDEMIEDAGTTENLDNGEQGYGTDEELGFDDWFGTARSSRGYAGEYRSKCLVGKRVTLLRGRSTPIAALWASILRAGKQTEIRMLVDLVLRWLSPAPVPLRRIWASQKGCKNGSG